MNRIALLTLIALNTGRLLAEPIQPAKAIKQESTRILIHENRVRYVIASKTDSYYKIAKQTGIKLSQLHHYNESFKEKDMLIEGDIIYLDPRRIKSKNKKSIVLKQSMSVRELAQQEALKLKPLMRRNHISSADEQLPCGREVFLR